MSVLPGFRLPPGWPQRCPRCGLIANGPNIAKIHTRNQHPEAIIEQEQVGNQ